MKKGDDKYPWFKLFTRDWLSSVQVRKCSIAARGAWIDLLCLIRMAGGGRLVPDSPAGWTDEALAQLLSGDQAEALAAVRELRAKRVLSFDDDGALVSERAVRDSEVSAVRAESGRRGSESKWQTDGKSEKNGWQSDGKTYLTLTSESDSCSSDSGKGSAEGKPPPRPPTVYGTPEPPGFRDSIQARWNAARTAGAGVGPITINCWRLLPATLDEVASCPELDEAARADPPGFLLRQLDAYLSSAEARGKFALRKLGSFFRQSDGKRKWMESAEAWNFEPPEAEGPKEEAVHDRIARQMERIANART